MDKAHILILDEGTPQRWQSFRPILTPTYSLLPCKTYEEALPFLEADALHYPVILLFIHDKTDLSIVQKLNMASCFSEIIVVASSSNTDMAIESLKHGVYDYIIMPMETDLLLKSVENALKSAVQFKKVDDYFLAQVNSSTTFQERFQHILSTIRAKRLQGHPASVDDLSQSIQKPENIVRQGIEEIRFRFSVNETKPVQPAVMIVEDDEEVSLRLSAVLNRTYTVFCAATGAEALTRLREHPEIAAILLDIYLPDHHGYELVPKLKELNPLVEISMMTAYGDQLPIAIASLRAGATDYLVKPIRKTDLFTTLAKLLQNQYFNRVIPHIKDDLLCELPYHSKIHHLEQKAKDCFAAGKELTMQDIYLYFPELRRELPLPEETRFPFHLTKDMADLIEGLKSRAGLMME